MASATNTEIDAPSTKLTAPQVTPRQHTNIRRGHTWEASFAKAPASIPSEVVPGLYLGNVKTAAAYLLGKVDYTYPAISRIVSIYPMDMHLYGFADLPEARGVAKKIHHLIIQKLDIPEVNLLEDFDRTGEFIDTGVRAYLESQMRLDNVENRDSGPPNTVRTGMLKLKTRLTSSWSTAQPVSPSFVARPSPIGHLNESLLTRTPVPPTATMETAQGVTSRSHNRPISAQSAYGANLMTTALNPANKQQIQERPGAVLVHCHAGISRSTSVVIAWLLKYRQDFLGHLPSPHTHPEPNSALAQSLKDNVVERAIAYVRSKRPIICPNIGFRMQLQVYHDKLGCSVKDEEGRIKDAYLAWYEQLENETQCRGLQSAARSIGNSVFSVVYNDR